jgi:hypothetical protein
VDALSIGIESENAYPLCGFGHRLSPQILPVEVEIQRVNRIGSLFGGAFLNSISKLKNT